jgi:protease II
VPLSQSREPYPFANSSFNERGGQFSPDGRWVAYSSDESGQEEIYIQSFPPGRRFTATGRGGKEPAWRQDGRELFYIAGDGKLTSSPVTLGETSIQFGQSQSLFAAPVGTFRRNYEVSRDGQRFLIATPASAGGASITVVLNWQAALGAR